MALKAFWLRQTSVGKFNEIPKTKFRFNRRGEDLYATLLKSCRENPLP